MAKPGATTDRKSFGAVVGGEGGKAGDASTSSGSTAQSTATWLKESFFEFSRKLFSSITSPEPPESPVEPIEIVERELKVVGEEKWVVLESSSASSLSSVGSGEGMSASSKNQLHPDGPQVNGGTPVSQRKRAAAGSMKSSSSVQGSGRTSSFSNKSQKSARPASPLPGSTHTPVQRKASSGTKPSSKSSGLEVQNGIASLGVSSSTAGSASPSRGRSNSPTRTGGKGSSSVRSSSPSRNSPIQGGRNGKSSPSQNSVPSTARSSSPVRSSGKGESKGESRLASSGIKSEGKVDSGKPPSGKAAADIKKGSQRTNSPSLGHHGSSNGVSGGSFRSKKKGILVSSSDVTSNQSAQSSGAALSNGVPQSGTQTHANGNSRVQPIPAISLPKEDGAASPSGSAGESGSSSAFEKVRDTLRISRPKKKKGKKLAYSIVVDPAVISTPEINLHNPNKYEDPFETSFAENGESEKKLDHDFKPASIPHNKPEYCDHCGDMAWGLYRQVLKCARCNFIAHRKCESKVLMACSSRLEQAILQHDKQVEDIERIAAVDHAVEETNKENAPAPATQIAAPPPSSDTPSSSSSTSASSESATPPVASATSVSSSGSTPNPTSSQFMAEKTKLSRKIREYNRKTTPVHHIHIKSTVTDPSNIEYHGFVRVHMSVQRPIHVSTAITRTSWYRLMRPVKERTLNDVDGYDIQTAFYLPLDTNRLVHIQNTTTTKELIQILLKKFCVTDNPKKFSLYEEYGSDCRRLFEEDRPLEISLDASVSHRNSKLVLRDNTYSTIQWDAFSAPELGNFIQILQREEELYIAKLEERFSMWRKSIQQALKDKCMEEQAKKTRKSVSSRLSKSKVSPKPGHKATSSKTSSKKSGK